MGGWGGKKRVIGDGGGVEEPSSEGAGMSVWIFKVPRMTAGVGRPRKTVSQVPTVARR